MYIIVQVDFLSIVKLFNGNIYVINGSFVESDPQDSHIFGPPVSGSISQRYGSGSESFPFLIKLLSGLKDCLQNKI